MSKSKLALITLILTLLGIIKFQIISVPLFSSLINGDVNININTVAVAQKTAPTPQITPLAPLEDKGIIKAEGKIYLKDAKTRTECHEIARISAQGKLIENAKIWVMTHSKLSGTELQQSIETVSKGVAQNSETLFDGIENEACVCRIKAKVAVLSES